MAARIMLAITVVGAIVGLGIKCQSYRKAEAEANLAALKAKAEADEQARKRQPEAPPAKAQPGAAGRETPAKAVAGPKPPSPEPKPPRTLRDLLVAGSVWEGQAEAMRFKMEVREVTGDTFTGRLHWSSGSKLVLTAGMSGTLGGGHQVTFRWRKEDIEFGSGAGFVTATHTGTLYAEPDPEIRGRWAYQTTSGSFRLFLVR